MKSNNFDGLIPNLKHLECLGKYPMILSGEGKAKYLYVPFDPITKEFIIPHVKFQIDRIEVKIPTMLEIDVWVHSYYPNYPKTKKGDQVRVRIISIDS